MVSRPVDGHEVARISGVTQSAIYINHWAQIRSKRLLESIAPSAIAAVNYNYSVEELTRRTTSVLQQAIRCVEAGEPLESVTDGLRRAAEIFENLARLEEGPAPDTSLLISAALYELAGYSANSQCMVREIELPALPQQIARGIGDILITRWVGLALRRQYVRLRDETHQTAVLLRASEEAFIKGLEASGDPGKVATELPLSLIASLGFEALATYALRGGSVGTFLETAKQAEHLLLDIGDTSNLLQLRVASAVARTIETNSMWTFLAERIDADPIWRRYATLMARGRAERQLDARGTVELWRSQHEALRQGLVGDSRRGLAIRMPTSAGKTRIAEMAILDELSRQNGRRAVYVAPFNALATEIESSLAGTLADLGFRVSSVVGQFDPDELESQLLQSSSLLVVTPEKLALMLRAQPDFFASVGLVVLDEGHIIDSADRGASYELLLTRLKRSMPEDSRFIFLSAVINEANVGDFAEWLCSNREAVVNSDWRPSRLLIGIFNATSGRIEYPLEQEEVPGAIRPFVLRALTPDTYTDYTTKLRKEKQVTFPGQDKGEQTAELAIKFANQGPVLIFTTQRVWAESVAGKVQRGLTLRRQTESVDVPAAFARVRDASTPPPSVAVAEQWLGEDSSIPGLLRDGIGVHHAGLPEAVQRAIEADYRSGRLPVLAATSTLAQGVNLPVRTVLVHTTHLHIDDQDTDEDIEPRISLQDFWNIAGRAGRAGSETEGHVVFVAANNYQANQYQNLLNQQVEPVRGRLYHLLEQLAEGRLSNEAFRAMLDSELIAMLVEESVGTSAEESFADLVGGSFVSIQARDQNRDLTPLTEKATTVIRGIREEVPDDETKRVFSLTGLDVASCQEILQHVQSNSDLLRNILSDENASVDSVIRTIYPAISKLQPLLPTYEFAGDMEELLSNWLDQLSMRELIERHLAADADERKFHRFITDYFGYHLPWGISAYVRIATNVLSLESQITNTAKWLPSMVRYGVNSHRATWAMTLGCPSRDLSASIVFAFSEDRQERSYGEFIDWFSSQTEEDFVWRMNANSEEARVLVRKANTLIPPGGEVTSAIRSLPSDQTFSVVGIHYDGRASRVNVDLVKRPVDLVREYSNRYDSNAIAVLVAGAQLGYVPRSVARIIAPAMDAGFQFRAIVESITTDPIGVLARVAPAPSPDP